MGLRLLEDVAMDAASRKPKSGEVPEEEPRVCPKCKSPYWNRPRRVKRTNNITVSTLKP